MGVGSILAGLNIGETMRYDLDFLKKTCGFGLDNKYGQNNVLLHGILIIKELEVLVDPNWEAFFGQIGINYSSFTIGNELASTC